jgi:hypothetical protein
MVRRLKRPRQPFSSGPCSDHQRGCSRQGGTAALVKGLCKMGIHEHRESRSTESCDAGRTATWSALWKRLPRRQPGQTRDSSIQSSRTRPLPVQLTILVCRFGFAHMRQLYQISSWVVSSSATPATIRGDEWMGAADPMGSSRGPGRRRPGKESFCSHLITRRSG